MDSLHLLDFFPDVDLELISLAFNPRGSHRVSDRVYQRLKSKYGLIENSNKVLEYIGDSVLSIIAMNQVRKLFGLSLRPSEYHDIHRSFITNENLTQISIQLGICNELFPKAILNHGSDWHNPCSNSMEALLGALDVQYEDIPRIQDWFFSLRIVADNFRYFTDRYIRQPSPVSSPEPEGPESPDTFEGPEIVPVEIPTVPAPERVVSPDLPPSPKPEVRMGEVNRDFDGLVYHRFPTLIRKVDGNYLMDHIPDRKLNVEGIQYQNLKPLDIVERISQMYRRRSAQTGKIQLFRGGQVPIYSQLFPSPEDGWWGWYVEDGESVFLLNSLVPSQREFELSKEALADDFLQARGIRARAPIEASFNIVFVRIQQDVGALLDLRIYPVGRCQFCCKLAIEFDIKQKTFISPSNEQIVLIIDEWKPQFVTEKGELKNIRKPELPSEPRMFYGKFTVYSRVYGKDLYGYGLRYLKGDSVGEIPISFLTDAEHQESYRLLLNSQMVDLFNRLDVIKTTLPPFFAPADPNKYPVDPTFPWEI